MKTALLAFGMAILLACGMSREIEVSFVNAELVKIDTVYRYPNTYEQVLTWKSDANVQYVSYVSIAHAYAVGSRMMVLVKK